MLAVTKKYHKIFSWSNPFRRSEWPGRIEIKIRKLGLRINVFFSRIYKDLIYLVILLIVIPVALRNMLPLLSMMQEHKNYSGEE